ncbi:MAG: Xaa-Pro dipeptidase [Gammaproteobacteria bacterium]|jgi:Xaa-Pro dipeptidase|nr:Xaa-Pro dipeptidase [Gammaproteobacteria bacterium]
MVSRRSFIAGACAAAAAGNSTRAAGTAPAGDLKSITTGVQPISAEERMGRIARVQALMTQQKISALLVESGSSLEYFTGISWRRSERITAAVIPAKGAVLVVTPAFEEPSVRETLQVGGDVRIWNEPENPFEKIVEGLRDRGVAGGVIAVEPTVRFFIVDGVRHASDAYSIVSGDALVRACRLIKSPAELALLQVANDVTIQALRWVHSHVARGMHPSEIEVLMNGATIALGGAPEFSLVLLNEASAYPHGSKQAQSIRDGSVILMDCGCVVQGYQSDISRTWVFGDPSPRQRKVWNTVKRGQEIALETAKPGVRAGAIDDAVRRYYEQQGWGPGYRLPGLSHRTGHGIGLDGHEPAYLVHGDETPLQAGMCFSDEPGIYIPGEFGVRLEDCWHMTAAGPKTFTPLAKSLDEPI